MSLIKSHLLSISLVPELFRNHRPALPVLPCHKSGWPYRYSDCPRVERPEGRDSNPYKIKNFLTSSTSYLEMFLYQILLTQWALSKIMFITITGSARIFSGREEGVVI
jgi:hypothetical protein